MRPLGSMLPAVYVDLSNFTGYDERMEKRKIAVKAYKFASLADKDRGTGKQKNKNNPAGFVKEGTDTAGKKKPGNFTGQKGYRKAAKFLLLLGEKEAAKVLGHFSDAEIQIITREIASIKKISKEESRSILQEFGYFEPKKPYASNGGIEAAREMLCNAFGEEKGINIFKKVLPFGGEKPFAFLEDLENEQLIMVLRKESVPVLAVIFNYLNPVKASVVLETLHPDMQKELISRMAGMRRVAPEALRAIEATLIERIRTQGKIVTEEIDGQSVLASILKNMNLSDEDRILSRLETEDHTLSDSIREKLFTVDTVLDMRDQDLQKVLRDFSDREVAFLLKGRRKNLRDKLLDNLSDRRKEFIHLEEESLGPQLRSDVDKSMKDFLNYLRDLEIHGTVLFDREKDQYI